MKAGVRLPSGLEIAMVRQCRQVGLPAPEVEFRFDTERRFRFDLAWPDKRVAVEVDGGAWTNGRHVRGQGFHNDCVKFSLAASLGWRVLRVDAQMIDSGNAIALLEMALKWAP